MERQKEAVIRQLRPIEISGNADNGLVFKEMFSCDTSQNSADLLVDWSIGLPFSAVTLQKGLACFSSLSWLHLDCRKGFVFPHLSIFREFLTFHPSSLWFRTAWKMKIRQHSKTAFTAFTVFTAFTDRIHIPKQELWSEWMSAVVRASKPNSTEQTVVRDQYEWTE